jgi:predicted amidohydrolase
MTARLKIAAVQLCSGADPAVNFAQLEAAVCAAAGQGVRLVLLPENAIFMGLKEQDKLAVAEAYGAGHWQAKFAALAKAQGLYLVCGSFPLQVPGDPAHISPSSLVWNPSGVCIARYDKRHLFDVDLADGQSYRESKYFLAGSNAPQCFDCEGVRVGLSICYDLRFPELYRALSDAGAQLVLVPAAFTAATGQAHWEVLLKARAIENLGFVLAANQCGEHPGGQTSWGHSMIIDPWGQVLMEAQDAAIWISAEIDLEAQAQRRREFPVLQHRRAALDLPSTQD